MNTSKEELARFGNDQIKGVEYALEIKNPQGNKNKHAIDCNTYWKFHDGFSKLYGKTVVFKTTDKKRIRGILDNVLCQLDLKGTE